MSREKELFDKNIEAISNIGAIYQYMQKQVTAFDITELLRAEFVLIVSALDFYVHEVVRNGLVRKFKSGSCGTNNSINIPLSTVRILLDTKTAEEQTSILDKQIGAIICRDSYQAPRAIERAFNLIDIEKIWTKIGKFIGKPGSEVRSTLTLIIDRRNKIAHEADIDPTKGIGEKTSIDATTVSECMEFVTTFVKNLDKLIVL